MKRGENNVWELENGGAVLTAQDARASGQDLVDFKRG